MNSLYGNFRQVKFSDVYNKEATFVADVSSSGIPLKITTDSLKTLFYLLYASYGNSTIASSDINRFKYKLQMIIFQYGPAWEKRLEIQEKLRGLTEDELIQGGKAIYNHSYNPSTAPSTSSLEELTTINEQNTNSSKRSKLDAYSSLNAMLESDVTGQFVDKFKTLFLKIVEPEEPLWYETDTNDEEGN